jgi:hypothetical protein
VERRVHLQWVSDRPPVPLRVPTLFAGSDAFDVYELVDANDWPSQATFDYRTTIPRPTADEAAT